MLNTLLHPPDYYHFVDSHKSVISDEFIHLHIAY